MRRFEPHRRAQLPLCLIGAIALGLASPSTGRDTLAHGMDAARGSTSPAALAGRYERASAPGAYVDLHGPFTAVEARLVAGYRDAAGRPFVAPR